MPIKAITIKDNEKYLRQISNPVDLNDNNLSSDIAILEEFCRENEVMAMAAIQLGTPKRLIYIKNTNLDIINRIQKNAITENEKSYNEAKVLINPIIINRYGLTDYWEACASCLNFMGHVKRPYKIVVEYFAIDGKKYRETFEGFESTVLSHEIDHLDGILHMDIADEVLEMPKEERKLFRQTHPYNIVTKVGEYQSLLQDNAEKKLTK